MLNLRLVGTMGALFLTACADNQLAILEVSPSAGVTCTSTLNFSGDTILTATNQSGPGQTGSQPNRVVITSDSLKKWNVPSESQINTLCKVPNDTSTHRAQLTFTRLAPSIGASNDTTDRQAPAPSGGSDITFYPITIQR